MGRIGPGETLYRTMSPEDYSQLLRTGRMPATGETFTSPTQSFSQAYDGVTVKFKLDRGTLGHLEDVGVRDGSRIAREAYPDMPKVQSGWTESNAYFKGEGGQINIGLGRGPGLDTFNAGIRYHSTV